jgi:nucleotide sugar dehydrogenase
MIARCHTAPTKARYLSDNLLSAHCGIHYYQCMWEQIVWRWLVINILIVGTGYVGTTTALVFCEKGHRVTGLDIEKDKIRKLQSGQLHFFEPGLAELLRKHLRKGNLSFTRNQSKAIRKNDIIFICVGTPQDKDGSADLGYVRTVAETIGKNLNTYKLIVDKSTVPVGTAGQVEKWIRSCQAKAVPFDVVSNPEFLREGAALHDALCPDRVVIGHSNKKALKLMRKLYRDFTCPFVETTPGTAELIKYAANSFLALKISYINELARLCDVLELNIDDISKGIGLDPRIGDAFLKAGIGYGGSCFPKDVTALIRTAEANRRTLSILESAVKVNDSQPDYLIQKLRTALGTLENKSIAVLGVAFKPDTDDTRESPAIKIIDTLIQSGAAVKAHDPAARLEPDRSVKQTDSIEECVADTDAIILCTDWKQYRNVDWKALRKRVRSPYLIDGKNMLDADEITRAGFIYRAVGKVQV